MWSASKKNSHIAHPFEKLPSLQNGKQFLCQTKFWLKGMSRLSVHRWSICFVWQHIWFCSFDEARRPTCPVAGPPCASVHWCQRRQLSWKPAWKVCSFIRAETLGYCLLRRFSCEMEQNAELLWLPRSLLALWRVSLEVLDWTSDSSFTFVSFESKGKHTKQRKRNSFMTWPMY